MSKRQILIVTQRFDPHADHIIRKLRQMGYDPYRLHLNELADRGALSIDLSSPKFQAHLRAGNRTVDLHEVGSIWWRKPLPVRGATGLPPEQAYMSQMEYGHAVGGLWPCLDCYWMSRPERIRAAGYKPEQLKRAREFGFETPRTLITADPDAAAQFVDACGGSVIYKIMTDPSLGLTKDAEAIVTEQAASDTFKSVFATLISKAEMTAHLGQISYAPCQFQEYIKKRVELRVTVIGREVFVGEIDSQAQDRTRIDWRHYDVPMIVRKGSLPDGLRERCVRFVESYGLEFSTMDIIETPDGRHVFLENNPNGQWRFVEEFVPELRMSDALISRLLNGTSERTAAVEPPQMQVAADLG